MLKVLKAKQIREADNFTIKKEPIASIDLMERAANNAFKRILEISKKPENKSFIVFCGPGNNGGDGLVIARKLLEKGYSVITYTLNLNGKYSEDFVTNLNRYSGEPIELNQDSYEVQLEKESIIIDALFGTGLGRPLEGFIQDIIEQLNESGLPIVSIDMPSGLFAEDNKNNKYGGIIKATYTLSFEVPKLAFLLPENSIYVGNWEVIPIGLHPEFIQEVECEKFYFTKQDAKSILKLRNAFSHKGTFGHALLIAGCTGKMGAAVLAAKAAMRSGLGLLSVQIPKSGYEIMQVSVPEAMVVLDENENFVSTSLKSYPYPTLGIGPGIGTEEETQSLFKRLIQDITSPIVIDADALNILSENKTWLSFLPKGSILTPHPGEFRRLVGDWESDLERLELQVEFAKKFQIYLVLKGRHTSIACPSGKVFFNSTGNSGMATGGSGDTLTGIITGLLAQGYLSEQAALLGVYLHGLAGDFAADKLGEESLIASDISFYLPNAFLSLKN